MKKFSLEMKVGLFAIITIGIIVYCTLRVSDKSLLGRGSYSVSVVINSAEGLNPKTPVEIAGIQVGYIERLELEEGRRARAILRLMSVVKLGLNAQAQVRTKGFLGETYVDLKPGDPDAGMITNGGSIDITNSYVDMGQIAADVKDITNAIKSILSEENGAVPKILQHMEEFTKRLADISGQNQENVNQIVANLRNFSGDLSQLMADRKESLRDTMIRIDNVTRKVDEGRGTVGRLLNDDEIADNINNAARGLSETVGGINRFQAELGYHIEYLGTTHDFKNYSTIILKPRPDKYFMLEFIADPNPAPDQTITTTKITSGGNTTSVVTDQSVVQKDVFRISAQVAKSFYDITFRGGLIESSGGFGVDYNYGPFSAQFSAFNFRTDNNMRPHLKVLGSMNVTPNIYLLSGVDDFISKQQNPDWFVGAGLRFVDNDIKSLFGAASLKK